MPRGSFNIQLFHHLPSLSFPPTVERHRYGPDREIGRVVVAMVGPASGGGSWLVSRHEARRYWSRYTLPLPSHIEHGVPCSLAGLLSPFAGPIDQDKGFHLLCSLPAGLEEVAVKRKLSILLWLALV